MEPPEVDPPLVDPPDVEPPEVDPPLVEPPDVEPPEVDPPDVEPPLVVPPEVDPPVVFFSTVTVLFFEKFCGLQAAIESKLITAIDKFNNLLFIIVALHQ